MCWAGVEVLTLVNTSTNTCQHLHSCPTHVNTSTPVQHMSTPPLLPNTCQHLHSCPTHVNTSTPAQHMSTPPLLPNTCQHLHSCPTHVNTSPPAQHMSTPPLLPNTCQHLPSTNACQHLNTSTPQQGCEAWGLVMYLYFQMCTLHHSRDVKYKMALKG